MLKYGGFAGIQTRGLRPSTFIGFTTLVHTGATEIVALPAEARAGDIAILANEFNASAAGTAISGGWAGSTATHRAWSYDATIHMGAITAGQETAGTIGVAGCQDSGYSMLAVYRGATGAALRTDFGALTVGGPSISLPGFTPSSTCRGVVALVSDRDPDVTPTPPVGWVARGAFGGSVFAGKAADLLVPTSYVPGAAITFTTMQGAANYGQHGWVVELI